MLANAARSLARPSRLAFAMPVATRAITNEAFNTHMEGQARAHAAALARAKVPEPTPAQIEAHEKLIEAMKLAADRPAKTRMVGVMDAAIAADNLDYAFLAVQEINKRGYQQDPTTLTRLVQACVEAGEVDRAYQLVDSFINFGVLATSKSLALLINGYVKINEPLKAFSVFSNWDNVDDAAVPDADMLKGLQAALEAGGFAQEAATVKARM